MKKGARSSKEPSGRSPEAVISGVRLSNPDKVLYPEQGVTKRDLAEYYERIAERVLPHVVDRPLSVVRCPAGRQAKCFYQKHAKDSMGEAIQSVTIEEKRGKGDYIYIRDLAGLVTLVQMGVLEIHPWGSRVDRYERPDRMVFDLDPDPSVSFADVIAAARLVRERLAAFGLASFVKTTGGKGLHVVVPLVRRNTWEQVRGFSEAVARAIVREDPEHYVANMRKEKRKGRVYIDFLRNSRGATSVAAYSTRARPGAPVSTPLGWDELAGDSSATGFGVESLSARLASLGADPWEGFEEVRQSLTRSMLEREWGEEPR